MMTGVIMSLAQNHGIKLESSGNQFVRRQGLSIIGSTVEAMVAASPRVTPPPRIPIFPNATRLAPVFIPLYFLAMTPAAFETGSLPVQ